MAEAIPEWRKRWDEECPLMIGVEYSGWESGSDAALRDELKRIRDVGFTAVRVHFNREGDIEKMAGMVNWRNPDRFFDAAEKAGLKVLAAPGNSPHSNAGLRETELRYSDAAIANISAWLQKFCGQYRDHPALLAWILQEEDFQSWNSVAPEQEAQTRQDDLARLLAAFHAADPLHPVVTTIGNSLDNVRRDLPVERAAISDVVGSEFHLQDSLIRYDYNVFESELDRPAYLLARFTTALASTSAIPVIASCTSGTIRYHGSYAAAMTEGKITRLLLLFLVAGIKTICFDRWKPERRGPNAGEDALLDWLDHPTSHALAAGQIARAVNRCASELWHVAETPQVHLLYSKTNDLLAQINSVERSASTVSDYENQPVFARLGAARVLLNANIPFAFLTEQQLIDAVVPPAPILFLPHIETLSEPLLLKLKEYAQNGGRVVADMPTGYLNEKGELLDTRPGSPFEQLFGASVAGLFCFSNPAMRDAEPTHGQQRANLVVTTARAGGGSGETPAFTENRVGKGRAVLVNLSLSRLNAAPNLQNAQLSLLSYILGSKQTALTGLTNCLVFRRTAEHAEHVFLVNDSAEERTVEVAVAAPFTQAQDALTEESLAIENNAVRVTVPPGSGRWLRLAK